MDDVIFAGSGQPAGAGPGRGQPHHRQLAGLLPIDFTEVTITRTLFRSSGESEYAINGVPCRLLDVQELLSDTGVGRQQHVIVSQGQLDAVLDARPEDRRPDHRGGGRRSSSSAAARRRPSAAWRPPRPTCVRLADLLREVRRQLRPAGAPGRRRPPPRRRWPRSCGRCACTWPAASWPPCGPRGRKRSRPRPRRWRRGGRRQDRARPASTIGGGCRELAVARSRARAWARSLGRLEALRERARGLAAVLAERRRSLGTAAGPRPSTRALAVGAGGRRRPSGRASWPRWSEAAAELLPARCRGAGRGRRPSWPASPSAERGRARSGPSADRERRGAGRAGRPAGGGRPGPGRGRPPRRTGWPRSIATPPSWPRRSPPRGRGRRDRTRRRRLWPRRWPGAPRP